MIGNKAVWSLVGTYSCSSSCSIVAVARAEGKQWMPPSSVQWPAFRIACRRLRNLATAWITQRTHSKRELLGTEIRARETLYGEFIRECSKLVVDSFTHTLDKPETLLPVYELLNRIRLCASDAVLAEAEEMLKRITEQYSSPNLSVEEIRKLVQVAGPRSTQIVRRGVPRRTQIDPRSGVAVQPG